MIIAYENWLMHLLHASPNSQFNIQHSSFDDHHLDEAFAALTGGSDVWVSRNHSIRHLHQYLNRHFLFVKAAGGIVTTPRGDCLMIARDGRWDLPKGMVERGETLRQAARREVMEETGVEPTAVGGLIAKTYHIYNKYGGWHLKQTSWFAMTAPRQATHPQSEEGIAQAVWVAPDVCRKRLMASYASLRLVALATHLNF